MQRTTHTWRRACVPLVGLLLLLVLPTGAWAGTKCVGPYALTDDGYVPAAAGDDVRQWPGDATVNLAITAGTLSVAIEGKLDGGDFAGLGTMTTTSTAQFHGPLHRVRALVSSCSSCDATIVLCFTRDE